MNSETCVAAPYVQTVTGPVSELGHVQCHEHIYLRKGPSYDCNAALCMDNDEKSLKELQDYRVAGGCTIDFDLNTGLSKKVETGEVYY